jgi:hypothetical protein
MTASQTTLSIQDFKSGIESAKDGRQMLAMLTDRPGVQSLIPQLSVDDLYLCLQMVGVEDSETVLALASGAQVQGLVDIDGWERDKILPERVQPWLQALMRAGPEVMTRRMLDLDDALLMFLVRHHVDAFMIEDPDDFEPPSEMHVFTPDRQTCLVFKTDEDQNLPIRIFLDTLMRFDTAHCLNLLAHINSTLMSNLEEQSFRWRAGRVADRGYIDYYEALKIYAPLPRGFAHTRPAVVDGFTPSLKSKALMGWRQPDEPLARAVGLFNSTELETFHYETALASNMALSADRVELWDTGGQYHVLQRIRNGIQLGLLLKLGTIATDEMFAELLKSRGAIELFRIGYQATKSAVTDANQAIKRNAFRSNSGALGAIDLPLLETWAERLTQRHPHLGEHAQPGTLEALELIRLWSQRLSSVADLMDQRPREVGAICWAWTRFLSAHFNTKGPFNQTHLKMVLEIGGHGDDARQALAVAFKAWWQSHSTQCDEQFMDTVFETVFDEIFTLTRSDLPEDATLQYILLS